MPCSKSTDPSKMCEIELRQRWIESTDFAKEYEEVQKIAWMGRQSTEAFETLKTVFLDNTNEQVPATWNRRDPRLSQYRIELRRRLQDITDRFTETDWMLLQQYIARCFINCSKAVLARKMMWSRLTSRALSFERQILFLRILCPNRQCITAMDAKMAQNADAEARDVIQQGSVNTQEKVELLYFGLVISVSSLTIIACVVAFVLASKWRVAHYLRGVMVVIACVAIMGVFRITLVCVARSEIKRGALDDITILINNLFATTSFFIVGTILTVLLFMWLQGLFYYIWQDENRKRDIITGVILFSTVLIVLAYTVASLAVHYTRDASASSADLNAHFPGLKYFNRCNAMMLLASWALFLAVVMSVVCVVLILLFRKREGSKAAWKAFGIIKMLIVSLCILIAITARAGLQFYAAANFRLCDNLAPPQWYTYGVDAIVLELLVLVPLLYFAFQSLWSKKKSISFAEPSEMEEKRTPLLQEEQEDKRPAIYDY